ncbi:MAG: EamA family transporter [Spirochaetes bacterium]|nr:EamA family transporter [Spirochaetota bacterium]
MPFEKGYLLFGLTAAIIYAIAASSLKTASDRGAKSLHTTLIANIVTAFAFMAFVPWTSGRIFPQTWWPSIIVGVLFAAGQLCTVLALSRGHASVATPVMGSKAVIVAFTLVLFGRPIGIPVWIGALLTSIGIAVLAFQREKGARGMAPSIIFALLAALFFAVFDALTQLWSPGITFGRLIPWAMLISAVATVPPLLIMNRGLPALPRQAIGYLALGVALLTTQSLILIWSIGAFSDAAGLNVVYGSRGIWSVLVVWMFGHHFSKDERFTGTGTVVRRLAAASLIAAAIVLVFVFR